MYFIKAVSILALLAWTRAQAPTPWATSPGGPTCPTTTRIITNFTLQDIVGGWFVQALTLNMSTTAGCSGKCWTLCLIPEEPESANKTRVFLCCDKGDKPKCDSEVGSGFFINNRGNLTYVTGDKTYEANIIALERKKYLIGIICPLKIVYIYTRSTTLSDPERQKLYDIASSAGFDRSTFQTVPQENCNYFLGCNETLRNVVPVVESGPGPTPPPPKLTLESIPLIGREASNILTTILGLLKYGPNLLPKFLGIGG